MPVRGPPPLSVTVPVMWMAGGRVMSTVVSPLLVTVTTLAASWEYVKPEVL